MNIEKITSGSPIERIGFFLIPGLVQGLAFYYLLEHGEFTPLRFAFALFFAVAPSAYFLTTAEGRRLNPAIFSVTLGGALAILAYLAQQWSTQPFVIDAVNEQNSLSENAQVSTIIGALIISYIAIPAYRTIQERKERLNHYPSLFEFAWTLPVIILAAGAFVGAVWLIAMLIGAMFGVIGVDAISNFLAELYIIYLITYGASALGIGIIRQRERLVLAMRGLLLMLVRVIAPIFAIAIIAFLIMLFVGSGSDQDAYNPIGTLIGTILAGIIFFNAVLDAEGNTKSRVLKWSAQGIALIIPVLSSFTLFRLRSEIEVSGWEPQNIASTIFVVMLTLYSVIYAIAAILRANWPFARQANIALAGVLIIISIWIQTPLFAINKWSATSQEKLILASGEVTYSQSQMLRFSLGAEGYNALKRLAQSDQIDEAGLARVNSALNATNRWGPYEVSDVENRGRYRDLKRNGEIAIIPSDSDVPEDLFRFADNRGLIGDATQEFPTFFHKLPGNDGPYAVTQFNGNTQITTIVIPTEKSYASHHRYLQTQHHWETAEAARQAVKAMRANPAAITTAIVPVLSLGGQVMSPYPEKNRPAFFASPPELFPESVEEQ